MNRILIYMTLIFLAFGTGTDVLANSRKSVHSELEREIQRIYDDVGMTALSIAVVKGDSIIYRNLKGYRTIPDSISNGDPLQQDDLFDIMSVSKTFVATAIMRLVEDKKMKLNDPADKYLKFRLRNPRYPDVPITVKQLLTHTSSLNENHCWWILDSINPQKSANYALGYSPTVPAPSMIMSIPTIQCSVLLSKVRQTNGSARSLTT